MYRHQDVPLKLPLEPRKERKVYGTIDYNFTVVSSVVLYPLMKYAPQQLQAEEEGAELLWPGRPQNIKSEPRIVIPYRSDSLSSRYRPAAV